MPAQISLSGLEPAPGTKLQLLGSRKALTWQSSAGRTTITLPASIVKSPPCRHAFAFRFTPARPNELP
jgi:hypothetical protein